MEGSYVYDVNATPKMSVSTAKPSTPDTPTTPSESGTTTSTSNTSTLPQTGQLKWPIPVMEMLGLILLLCGFFLRSGKEDTYEA